MMLVTLLEIDRFSFDPHKPKWFLSPSAPASETVECQIRPFSTGRGKNIVYTILFPTLTGSAPFGLRDSAAGWFLSATTNFFWDIQPSIQIGQDAPMFYIQGYNNSLVPGDAAFRRYISIDPQTGRQGVTLEKPSVNDSGLLRVLGGLFRLKLDDASNRFVGLRAPGEQQAVAATDAETTVLQALPGSTGWIISAPRWYEPRGGFRYNLLSLKFELFGSADYSYESVEHDWRFEKQSNGSFKISCDRGEMVLDGVNRFFVE
eukprot:TRINITY_DN5164_c0_g2_i1.p1 TRINITY_DN5164_c0_g2~~TRINITY_DN5164_c0_g2_i1.p1  ORF type:complete len:261 (+),score=20.91 TRINITY_DN5164_c0_g2_i1:92-874(+)